MRMFIILLRVNRLWFVFLSVFMRACALMCISYAYQVVSEDSSFANDNKLIKIICLRIPSQREDVLVSSSMQPVTKL